MNTLPALSPGQLLLVTGEPRKTQEMMQELAVRAVLRTPVRVLIGGNRFSTDEVTYRLAGQSYLFYEEALERIHLSRAFTCYQMVALLRQTPSSPLPTLVLDLLTTFADESVSDQEADYLVGQCEDQLQRLSRAAPVVVSAHAHANRERLLGVVEEGADVVLCLEGKSTAPAVQGVMF